jgi:ABC-type Mn2+/Zn2+ transport system permease subunit
MRQFTIFSSVIGGVASFIGFWIAYQWDLPVGPTDVVLLGIIYAFGFAVKKRALLFRPKSTA